MNTNGNSLRYECVQKLGIRSICTYLGSNEGDDPTISEAVSTFGEILAANDIRLVCGGGGRGLMRKLVESVLRHGGYVVAVTPEDLVRKEGGNPDIQEQIVVGSMGERKLTMFQRSDAFVTFPGGIGSLEELAEQLTWRQLGHHRKPIGLYNHLGFWDPLLELFHTMRRRNLITTKEPIEYGVAHEVSQILPIICGEMESRGRVHKSGLDFNEKLFGAEPRIAAQA